VAQRQGQTAARNLLAGAGGDREPFAAVPFFWSAHYDVTIAYAGHAAWWGAVEILGQPAARDAEVRYRAGGRVVAVATVGRDRASLAAEAALETVPAAGCGDRAMTSLQPSATPVVRPLPLAAPSDEFVRLVRRQLTLLGEDPHRAGLARTPERVAASLAWLTRGYSLDVAEVLGDAVFEEAHESMVMVRDIELYSLCEHHMLPFLGRAHIAYIPDGRIVGLSKLPRIVEVFARRLQVQERLTEQIAQAIEDVLRPRGVGVVIEAVHLCMMMRGVEKQNSSTITSALRGVFRECSMTRDEFLRLAHGRR
jgi:GTP cyclohydrolase I